MLPADWPGTMRRAPDPGLRFSGVLQPDPQETARATAKIGVNACRGMASASSRIAVKNSTLVSSGRSGFLRRMGEAAKCLADAHRAVELAAAVDPEVGAVALALALFFFDFDDVVPEDVAEDAVPDDVVELPDAAVDFLDFVVFLLLVDVDV